MSSRHPLRAGKREIRDITVLPEGSTLKECFTVGAPCIDGNTIVYKGHDGTQPVIIIEASVSDEAGSAQLEQRSFWAEQLGPSLTQKLVDLFEVSGYRYLVLEFIEGKTLSSLISPIKGVYLQEKVLTEWAPSLYSLFSSLLDKNRESLYGNVIPWQCIVKPDHIIRDMEGRFRVILQGILTIKVITSEDRTDTTGFAPPEMADGRECDERSLVYISGAIIYYLITNGHERITGTASPRSINSRISPDLEKVLGKALAEQQFLRYQSLEEMKTHHIKKEASDTHADRKTAKEEIAPIVSQKGLVYHMDTEADHVAEADLKKMAVYVGIFLVAALCVLLLFRGWLGSLIAREKSPSSSSVAAVKGNQSSNSSRHKISTASMMPGADITPPDGSSPPDDTEELFVASPPFSGSNPQPTTEASAAEPSTQKPSVSAPALPGEKYPRVAKQESRPGHPKETSNPVERLPVVPVAGETVKYFLLPKEQILAGLLRRKASDFETPQGHAVGNGTVITGMSATSTSKEPAFEIVVPSGYCQIKNGRKNFYEFATVDKGSQEISLRLLLIRPMALPMKSTPEQALAIYSASLEQKGAANVNMGETYVGDKLAFGFSYNMSVPLFDEPLLYNEVFYLSKDSNTVYIITESAPQSVFAKYKAEFAAFINSFKEY